MNSMFSRIILLLLNDCLWCFTTRDLCFFVYPNTNSIKNTSLCSILDKLSSILLWFGLLIVQRWCKVYLNVSINNTNCLILILGFYLKYINLKFTWKRWDRYCVSFMKTSKVSKLKLEYSFRIIKFNEFCFMGT